MLAKLEPKGIGVWPTGTTASSPSPPIRRSSTPADLKGKKLRIQSSKVLEEEIRSVGGLPQVMAFSEVYQALQTGVVDGTENPISNLYTQKMHEVQKHLTLTDHGYLGYAVIVNKKFWDGLPADSWPAGGCHEGGHPPTPTRSPRKRTTSRLRVSRRAARPPSMCRPRKSAGLQEGDGAGASEDGRPYRQGLAPDHLQRNRLRPQQAVSASAYVRTPPACGRPPGFHPANPASQSRGSLSEISRSS
jgi:hypothetical protein